jgi:Bacterial conjugation TrbI-like protein
MRKTIAIVLLLVLVAGAAGAWFFWAKTPPKRQAATSAPVNETEGLQQPSFHTERPVAPADAVLPQSTPEIVEVNPAPVPERPIVMEKKLAPMRIYTSTAELQPTPEEDPGDYAPAFQMVKCKLVNTIDSSNISTPVEGLVTDDLVWGGKIIIAKNSQVHGLAQVDKSRERIAAEGAWTFTLFEPDRCQWGDRELVLKGYALDREDDPEFKALMVGATVVDPKVKTWGITDGSAGLRGVVLRSNNAAELNLFVATFIAGIAQSVQGTATNVFGQTVPSPNVSGAGGVPGYIINPAAQGTEAVLDRYAQMVMDSIERDGFFIRVPAAKLFYVYVTEDILTGKATVGGSRRLRQVQSDFLEDRTLQERVTEPRAERDAKAAQEARNGLRYPPINPALTHRLDEAAGRLESRSEALQKESQELAQPSPTQNQ